MTNIPESNRKVFAITFIIAVIALFGFVGFTKYQAKYGAMGSNSDVMALHPDPSKVFDAPFTKAYLYYIDIGKYEEDLDNKNTIGCGDGLLPHEISIDEAYGGTKSDATLFALERLFKNSVFEEAKSAASTTPGSFGKSPNNVLAASKLTVESIKEVPGEYEVKIVGKLPLGGVCDDPRAQAMIENTIEQFFLPDSVEIFLNDKPLNEFFSQK